MNSIAEQVDGFLDLIQPTVKPGIYDKTKDGYGLLAIRTAPEHGDKVSTLTRYFCDNQRTEMFIRLVLGALQELIISAGLNQRIELGLIVKPHSTLKIKEEILIRMEQDLGQFSDKDKDKICDAILSWEGDRLIKEVFLDKLELRPEDILHVMDSPHE